MTHCETGATMRTEDVTRIAGRIMADAQHRTIVNFYDHWIGRLGLNPVVTRLEKRFADKQLR